MVVEMFEKMSKMKLPSVLVGNTKMNILTNQG